MDKLLGLTGVNTGAVVAAGLYCGLSITCFIGSEFNLRVLMTLSAHNGLHRLNLFHFFLRGILTKGGVFFK